MIKNNYYATFLFLGMMNPVVRVSAGTSVDAHSCVIGVIAALLAVAFLVILNKQVRDLSERLELTREAMATVSKAKNKRIHGLEVRVAKARLDLDLDEERKW